MSRHRILTNVRKISESVAESLNYELVDVEFIKENSDYYLRVYIYKDNGILLDDCQKMSVLLSEQLDAEDPIDVAYYLEVSSPGLDRPLKTDKDFQRNLEKEIEISLYKAINGMKKIEGILESFNDNELIVRTESSEKINVPRETVSLVKLAVKF